MEEGSQESISKQSAWKYVFETNLIRASISGRFISKDRVDLAYLKVQTLQHLRFNHARDFLNVSSFITSVVSRFWVKHRVRSWTL
jgi:hypothetical protein